MQAACGLAQLEQVDEFEQARKQNFAYLKERLKSCEEFLILPEATEHAEPSWFGFPLTLRESAPVNRLDLLRYLDQYKIGTRLLFAGNLIRQPYIKTQKYRISESLENTDTVMNNTFWLGIHPNIQQRQLEFTAEKFEIFLGLNF